MAPDHINAGFELVAGFLLTFNVVRIYRDKKTRGVSILPLAFMVMWGLWNCYFYPSLGVMWSFYCGIVCTAINGIWISQMIYYRRREKKKRFPGWDNPPVVCAECLQLKMQKAYQEFEFHPPLEKKE